MPSKARQKIDQIISRAQDARPNCALAIVKAVYPEEYKCDIMIVDNKNSMKVFESENVPLPMIGGMSYSMPHAGDKVLVEFLNGDIHYPLIVSIYPTTRLQMNNHSFVTGSTIKHIDKFRQ